MRLHWIHTVLFTITLPEYCLCCLHMLTLTMWYFFTITAHLTLQQCLQHIRNIYIQYCLQLLSPVYLLWCLHVLSFSQCEYFPHITVQLSKYNVYIESLLSPTVLFTITLPSILILLLTYAFLFTMWIFFNTLLYNCIYKMFTLNLYLLHTVLFTITLPSILILLFTYASLFTMRIFVSQSLPNSLYNNVYSISLT